MKSFHLNIITPKRVVYSDTVMQVTLPTKTGQITVMADHIALLSSLQPGEIMLKKEKTFEFLACSGGFIQVKKNTVTILADEVKYSSEIHLEDVHEALKKAKEALANYKESQDEHVQLVQKIKLFEASIKVREKSK